MMRTRIVLALGAFAALVGANSYGIAKADVGDPTPGTTETVTMHKGGHYGRLVGIRKARTPKLDGETKASTVTPIDPTGPTSDPTEVVPGRISIYNVGTGAFACLARVIVVRGGTRTIKDYQVSTDPGDPTHFQVSTWSTRMTVHLYEDVNGNGFIDKGDKLRRKASVWTSRAWAKRHLWLARQADLVVNGSGTPTNPPPVTGYPKGSVVSVNKRAGFTVGRIDYTIGTNVVAFNYPNIPFESWAYESFPGSYGASVAVAVKWNDNGVGTKTVTAPASSTADATVTQYSMVGAN